MADWPSELPQTPLLSGYSSTPQDSVLRTEMDGYTKQLNRYTATIFDVKEPYYMTNDQYAVFKQFYHGILGNGALEFSKVDPETGNTGLYRFSAPYDPQKTGLDWVVNCTLHRLP